MAQGKEFPSALRYGLGTHTQEFYSTSFAFCLGTGNETHPEWGLYLATDAHLCGYVPTPCAMVATVSLVVSGIRQRLLTLHN